jgi:hypothetical protein
MIIMPPIAMIATQIRRRSLYIAARASDLSRRAARKIADSMTNWA